MDVLGRKLSKEKHKLKQRKLLAKTELHKLRLMSTQFGDLITNADKTPLVAERLGSIRVMLELLIQERDATSLKLQSMSSDSEDSSGTLDASTSILRSQQRAQLAVQDQLESMMSAYKKKMEEMDSALQKLHEQVPKEAARRKDSVQQSSAPPTEVAEPAPTEKEKQS